MSSATVTPGISAVALDSSVQEVKDNIGKALGRIPSGVYIVTLSADGQRQGMMATWVAQAAFNPPTVTLAVNKERPLLANIVPDARLTLNVLSGKNMDIFKKFAGPAAEGVDRFDGLALEETSQAPGPVFSEAVSFLDCKVSKVVEAGDHVIVIAEVVGGRLLNDEPQPMVHMRKNGFGY
jgi:flavin reductase (DIM6/NTAB) family NADH-FMN oxidoreductase RutF